MDPAVQRYRFDESRRLHGRRAFAAVFATRCRKRAGPVIIYGKPNDLGYCRLGLSVSRKVGAAVKRNRIKRLLREAFRLSQHDFYERAGGYDMAVVVLPHAPARLVQYQHWLTMGVQSLHRQWCGRREQGVEL